MSKTIELRKDIQKLFKEVADKAYYRRAINSNIYPHVVYTIEDIGDAKSLNIDIWDKSESTERIEILADEIEKHLKDEVVTNDNHSFILYYNYDRQWIDDEDKNIQRINMTFEIRYYGKEK